MYCNNCGHQNQEGANFCSTCGATLRPEASDDTTLTFTLDIEGEGEEGIQIPLDELEEGKALIVVRDGPNAGTRFSLTQDMTMCGRDPSSDIFLDDVTVSRKHVAFHRVGSDFSMVDQGSLNGTYVNRARVDTHNLANGDEIQIGKFRLVFLTGSSS
jgi:pSer/pThr/pTyr-binding forkhead associated (FHA) protein